MQRILWQLRNLSTKENITEPIPLPENWGPIFGMANFKDKLHNLSWVGKPELGWFEIEVSESEISTNENKKYVDSQIEHYLNTTVSFVAADNNKMSKQERADWIEYRKLVREIPLQPGYPNDVYWPKRPDAE